MQKCKQNQFCAFFEFEIIEKIIFLRQKYNCTYFAQIKKTAKNKNRKLKNKRKKDHKIN
jgi:hypothetical protein